MNEIAILKCNPAGELMFRYEGKVVDRSANSILIEANFGLEARSLVDIQLNKGDRFLETYYTDRWFNIYEIHDKTDDHLKAWYSNVASPVEIGQDQIVFRDFALDLLVYPDGRQLILDEDEFAVLACSVEERAKAVEGLAQLQEHFRQHFK